MSRLPALLLLFLALPALANELTVSRKAIRLDESVEVTVTLTGSFAMTDSLSLPLHNLSIETGPYTSSQFQWINGVTSRQKTFRYVVRPRGAGAGSVGPILVVDSDGKRETLPQIEIGVEDQPMIAASNPSEMLQQMLDNSREPFFVVAEMSAPRARVGQQVMVTWYLYSGDELRGARIMNTPVLDDFWSEEIPVDNLSPAIVVVGRNRLQRTPLRRVALYPLHAGTVRIGPLEVRLQTVERMGHLFGSFSFEGRLTEFRRTAPPLSLIVEPIPAGEFDVVGDVTVRCSRPRTSPNGLVLFNVDVEGRANLRTARAPRLAGPVDGRVQIQARITRVDRSASEVRMKRGWSYIIFPARSGTLQIPPVEWKVFDPTTGKSSRMRCGGSALDVVVPDESSSMANATPPPPGAAGKRIPGWVWIGGSLFTALAGVFLAIRLKRRIRVRLDPKYGELLEHLHGDPRALRRILDEACAAHGLTPSDLFTSPSELGDSYRALSSAIESLAGDSMSGDEGDFRKRAEAFFAALARFDRSKRR